MSEAVPTTVQPGRAPLRRAAFAGWLLAPVLAFTAATEASHLGLVLCPFRFVTHLPCPGCGMTRALLALCQGDLHGAILAHPLSPFMALVLGGWWINNLCAAYGLARPLRLPDAITRLWWLALIAVLALWAVRLAGYLPLQ